MKNAIIYHHHKIAWEKIAFSIFGALFLLSALSGCAENQRKEAIPASMSIEGYALTQSVILSRHNIRSPLSEKGSLLDRMTPYSWHEWSSSASELTLKGGVLETQIGQYFREYLENEGLFPANYQPSQGEVRIYANAKQRTIATSNYFSSGLLPSFPAQIEVHAPYDTMDPIFFPRLTFVSSSYAEASIAQIKEMFQKNINGLEDNYQLLSDVVDLRESKAYQSKEVGDFRTDDLSISLSQGKEPSMTGSLKNACSLSDALVLQYYEESDAKKAGFGRELSFQQWKDIAEIKDVYGDVLFSAPLVSVNVAHPLLQTIADELHNEGRKFTYLCGHDSNISSVLASLDVEDYVLPSTLEKTPIGSKVVFNSFINDEGENFYGVYLVYQTTDQLRNLSMLDLDHPPMAVPLSFKGLHANKDGLYPSDELLNRFETSIASYDEIISKYGNKLAE